MSSRVTSDAATAQADVAAVFDSLARAMESYAAEFESDAFRVVWREHLASLTYQMIEKVRECICKVRAIVEAARPGGDEPGRQRAEEFERTVLGPLASGLIVGMLLRLNEVLCRPFLLRPIEAQTAALIARNAVLEGDSDTVDAFTGKVLGKKHPARWREAVEMALLGDWVASLGTGTATKPYVRDLLKRHAAVQHRCLQPVWEGRIKGQSTVLLAQPVDESRTIADLLVTHRTPEQDFLATERDVRVSTVLKHLSDAELEMALAWAEHGDPWPVIANELGQERKLGERVRRKLRRLGDGHTGQDADAERTSRGVM
ncbi:hypothetical protein AQJ23_16295 [Streptomyces antibioticus]|nr:hypothetical protein [Streptomyces antibioticus]KUN25446.1 hypothetical protein AQJ23_16295 [Streptomyces antibioticus]